MKCDVCGKPLQESDHAPCEERRLALVKALDVFGPGAKVGYGNVSAIGKEPLYYVGKTEKGAYLYFGAGNSWGEAFKNTRRVLFHFDQRIVLEKLPEPKKEVAETGPVCWRCKSAVKPDFQGAYICTKCGVKHAEMPL